METKLEIAERYAAELTALARGVIAANRYVVLGTIDPDGRPRTSPVFYNHHEHRRFYWVSSPDAQHSRNVADDPRVGAVVFDSSVAPGPDTAALFLGGTATEVPAADLESEISVAFAQSVPRGARPFSVEELTLAGDLRLYRLDVTTAEIHARGGHPLWGLGVDTRLPVSLEQPGS